MCVEIHAYWHGKFIFFQILFILHDHHDHGAMHCSTAMD